MIPALELGQTRQANLENLALPAIRRRKRVPAGEEQIDASCHESQLAMLSRSGSDRPSRSTDQWGGGVGWGGGWGATRPCRTLSRSLAFIRRQSRERDPCALRQLIASILVT